MQAKLEQIERERYDGRTGKARRDPVRYETGRDLRERGIWREPQLWYGALAVLLGYFGIAAALNFNIFGHAVHDSFTLQALAWREGRLSLGQDYPWLELAIYNNDWYVSFPSVPALVMLPLTYIFGYNTPNTLVTCCYFIASYFGAYFAARRYRDVHNALMLALFTTLGCNMLMFSLYGGVWNQGQLMSFMLMTFCAAGLTSESRGQWAAGLVCLALAVGCRPFQAVFVPFALWMLYGNVKRKSGASFGGTLARMIPYVIAPALIALAYGWYNYARFGNPIEFGHNYLPEFSRDPDQPQMGLQYVLPNIANLLRLPWFNENRLEFPEFNGFAFYLANPMYASAFICAVIKLVRRRWDWGDTLIALGVLGGVFLTLMHKTLGGWQFGARYLCDFIPMLLLLELRNKPRNSWWETCIGIFAIAFNIYGTLAFHILNGGWV